uniref:Uncharacterized protein n=1 Tax=Romanomermis culicivorax TaxID=13658 RepID=A0A915IL02_ROMCU
MYAQHRIIYRYGRREKSEKEKIKEIQKNKDNEENTKRNGGEKSINFDQKRTKTTCTCDRHSKMIFGLNSFKETKKAFSNENNIPCTTTKNDEILQWLKNQNIAHDESQMKKRLLSVIRKYRMQYPKKYYLEEQAEKWGR